MDIRITPGGRTLVHETGTTLFRFQGEAPPITYLINEDFEGAGMPSGWYNSGTDFDSTVSPLQGLQSLRAPDGTFALVPNPLALNKSELHFKFRVRFSALPAAGSNFLKILEAGFTAMLELGILADGRMGVNDGVGATGSPATTVDAMLANTAYDIGGVYIAGTGSNGIVSAGFVLAGGTIPTSGNAFGTVTNSINTANAGGFQIFGSGGITNTDFDIFQAAEVHIP